jgi:hypothetical protein
LGNQARQTNQNCSVRRYCLKQKNKRTEGMRRFTRLTNGFSKKVKNHKASLDLHFMYYNFCRIHQKLRVTPAMAASRITFGL